MADTSLMYYNAKLASSQPRRLQLVWEITGAKTISPLEASLPVLPLFDAVASQAVIDDFLGTSSEFTLAQYDATSMGVDAFGCMVNMEKQCKKVTHMQCRAISTTTDAGDTVVQVEIKAADLVDSTLETALEVGADGNIGLKIDMTAGNLDAIVSGLLVIDVYWMAK
jgi:hypothetical protein